MTIALDGTSIYREYLGTGLRSDPMLTIDQWAEKHRQLTTETSVEPGLWRNDRTPYLVEIMKELSWTSSAEEVTFVKGTQIGGSECANNLIGGTIDMIPCPIMLVEPTVELAKRYSKQRIASMIAACPSLTDKVKSPRSRDSGNTTFMKEYPGGLLVITGANSAVGLRSTPVRILITDEEDAYPFDVDGEGDPTDLSKKRTDTFAQNRKIFRVSTPLEAATSRICKAYERSDQRRYHLPCPYCGHYQWLRWGHIVFTFQGVRKPERTAYECEKCNHLIDEHHKTEMLAAGKWIAAVPGQGRQPGFHLSGLYSPLGWVPWRQIVEEFLEATETHDIQKHKTWTNTRLAEPWEEKGERVEHGELKKRREEYPAQVPEPVIALTASIDVQDDRLEAECVGWGKGQESWSIDYQRWMGAPSQKDVWEQADAWLQQVWTHQSGVGIRIQMALIDSGGHHTKAVYEFVKTRQGRRVCASKGSSQPGARIVTLGSKDKLTGVQLFLIGTDTAKDTIFDWLKLDQYGPGYMHHPDLQQYDEEYFKQLTAEEKKKKFERGVQVGYYYKKIRSRNEALDLKVGNLAALMLLNPNLETPPDEPMGTVKADVPAPPSSGSGWVRRNEPPSGRGRRGWVKR